MKPRTAKRITRGLIWSVSIYAAFVAGAYQKANAYEKPAPVAIGGIVVKDRCKFSERTWAAEYRGDYRPMLQAAGLTPDEIEQAVFRIGSHDSDGVITMNSAHEAPIDENGEYTYATRYGMNFSATWCRNTHSEITAPDGSIVTQLADRYEIGGKVIAVARICRNLMLLDAKATGYRKERHEAEQAREKAQELHTFVWSMFPFTGGTAGNGYGYSNNGGGGSWGGNYGGFGGFGGFGSAGYAGGFGGGLVSAGAGSKTAGNVNISLNVPAVPVIPWPTTIVTTPGGAPIITIKNSNLNELAAQIVAMQAQQQFMSAALLNVQAQWLQSCALGGCCVAPPKPTDPRFPPFDDKTPPKVSEPGSLVLFGIGALVAFAFSAWVRRTK